MQALTPMRTKAHLFFWVAVLLPVIALADDPEGASATLTAQSSGPLPRNVTIEVRTADENPDYAQLVPVIERGLIAHDLATAPGGTFVLRFGYRPTAIPESEREDPNFSIVGRTGTASRSHMQMQLRLRNEAKGSRGNDILMTFELYQPGSPPLWQASVLVPDYGFDRNDILPKVTEMSINLLGQSGVHRIPLE